MKKTIGFLCAALLAALVFCMMPVPALASELTGTCGESVSYVYDTDTKVLTLTGTGATNDYTMRQSPFYATSIRNNCTTIVVGEGITRIGNYLFHYMQKVTSVTLPSTLESIGSYAMNNLVLLESLDLPESLTTLDQYCFGSCKKLTEVEIPQGVAAIPAQCFNSCIKLTSVTLPDSVTSIGNSAFSGCSMLTSVNMPAMLGSIGSTAFSASQITQVDLPASVTSLSSDSFSGCPALAAINVAEGNQNYCSVGGVLYVKDKSVLLCCPGGYSGAYEIDPVCTEIHYDAFQNCMLLTGVTIPASVTKIGNQAFQSSGITSITIPETVTVLENSFCQSCASLTEATVNASVELLDSYSFNGCSELTTVVLGPSIKNFGTAVFGYCPMLSSITLPAQLEAIPDNCFQGCYALSGIEIPETVTSIGMYAFESCSSITEFILPAGLESIGTGAFGRTAISTITIPAGVTTINGNICSNCQNLTEVDLLGEITYVGGSAFSNCGSLMKVTFHCAPLDPKNASPYAFNNTPKAMEIHYPSLYPEWDTARPFDQNNMTYNYVMDIVSPYSQMVSVEIRARGTSDSLCDLRFKFRLDHYDGYEVTARRVVFTNESNGRTFTLDCPNTLFRAEDGSYELITAILTYVPESQYSTRITAQAFIDVTGEWQGTLPSNKMTASVNELMNANE
ncbi:MAG: leucine-rich repeat domain-containing protein [Clostridia bacterium]|nr:leucine-rich repeat domain-containing protein [Clostridia bacterium]